ncbi:MAG: glycine cleavage system aminomethyltransferase GcvT [Acidobacteria bacterium]|nr:glycine cleavage system aminomethyltransferase GcvT [Acidobacteriota bacterium]
MQQEAPGLRKTPLNEVIRQAGAKLVDFAGWEMPVQFRSVIEEHLAVRSRAGLFDVSHMGEIRVEGRGALELLQKLTPNDVGKLVPGQAHYTALLTPQATFVDDILVYRRDEQRFLLCVNASNAQKDFSYIRENAGAVRVEDASSEYAQLALQGPRAAAILGRVADQKVEAIPGYHFIEGSVRGAPALLSRTGYTGEDGFEIYLAPQHAAEIWLALLRAGEEDGLIPCGLGARDTLRLEARMPLYGNDIDETVTPLEAGLGFMVHLEKGDFLGSAILRRQKEQGVEKKLMGFELTDRGIPRHGYRLRAAGREVGCVTSGTYSPSLKKSIGLGYLPVASARIGERIEVVIRGSAVSGQIVKTPFYKRPS